ncbi:hypothetical protein C2G38_2226633 [Gigaspora rosea]|uniref:Uncharacterized protein n=1 Tax=Gigaspora rosea TaxID=44941 RepID=A0A397TY47_9GLOM|nr:hypothetical protein C2G38_2226633 [Gigaspora rosea]
MELPFVSGDVIHSFVVLGVVIHGVIILEVVAHGFVIIGVVVHDVVILGATVVTKLLVVTSSFSSFVRLWLRVSLVRLTWLI